MSKILYVKGMNVSDTEDEDIWDDTKLNDAYDKAVRIANVEVAKRVAMSTNTQLDGKDNHNKPKKEKSSKSSKKKPDCKVGGFYRAVYEGDGLEYEAVVISIINNRECVVKFLGYDNSELVPINSLKPSLGSEERQYQIEQAFIEKADDRFANQYPNSEGMECSDRVPSPGSSGRSLPKKKSTKKKSNKNMSNGFEIPGMPFPMPNMWNMRNIGSMEMPFPPPPPFNFSSTKTDAEEQAIFSMLLSWYMSGYYAGLYQGTKRSKEEGRNE